MDQHSSPNGHYLNVAGLRTYHEVYGPPTGEPVVLLHGGFANADSWAAQVPELAARHRVFVPERRAHGRTPDVPGPITYQAMADDTAAYLDTLDVGPVHLVGWSDGAVVAALLAMDRPDLVRRMVLIGQYFTRDGQRPEATRALAQWKQEPPAFLRQSHDLLSPDGPDHFDSVFARIMRMWQEEPDIGPERLARIAAPTLVMQGDADVVRVEHSAAVARAIPGAQLAVVPGTSHALPLERPTVVNQLVLDFLTGQPSLMLMPLNPEGGPRSG